MNSCFTVVIGISFSITADFLFINFLVLVQASRIGASLRLFLADLSMLSSSKWTRSALDRIVFFNTGSACVRLSSSRRFCSSSYFFFSSSFRPKKFIVGVPSSSPSEPNGLSPSSLDFLCAALMNLTSPLTTLMFLLNFLCIPSFSKN